MIKQYNNYDSYYVYYHLDNNFHVDLFSPFFLDIFSLKFFYLPYFSNFHWLNR